MSGLSEGKKRFVKRTLGNERPTVWIGKSGASLEVLKEVERQLEKNKMVKVKILQSGLGGEPAGQIALTIAGKTSSSLVEVRGHTFMLYRRSKK